MPRPRHRHRHPGPRRPLTLLAATALLLGGGTAAYAAPAEPHASTEHIVNGTFTNGTDPWWSTDNVTLSVVDGQLCAAVPGGLANPWDASIGHNGIPLVTGASYALRFRASADAPVTVQANVQLNEAPYTTVLSRAVTLDAQAEEFSYEFTGTLDSANGTLTFQLGGPAEGYTFCLDDVSLTSDAPTDPPGGAEQIRNGDFSNGTAGWYSYGTTASGVVDGRLCSEVPGGLANPWDAGVGQNDIPLIAGETYVLSFDASAEPGATVRVTVQLGN